jgi:uncharacterized membrane protein YtjA (UPF0391 family)
MKHPRTTISGSIAKIAHVIWVLSLTLIIWDLSYSYAPQHHVWLIPTFLISALVDAIFSFMGHWHAADAKEVDEPTAAADAQSPSTEGR